MRESETVPRAIYPHERNPQLTRIYPSTSAPKPLHVNYIKPYRKTKLVSLVSGWVEVEFKLCNKEGETAALAVPILVSDDPKVAERPIIGYNVIKEVVTAESPGSRVDPTTIQTVRSAFSIRLRIAMMVVKLIQTPDLNESLEW